VVFVGFGSDLAGAGDRGGENSIVPFLLLDIHEDGTAGLHLVHESFVSIGHSSDLLLIEDLSAFVVMACSNIFWNLDLPTPV